MEIHPHMTHLGGTGVQEAGAGGPGREVVAGRGRNGSQVVCGGLALHAGHHVLYLACNEEFYARERESDLHFGKISDLPSCSGQNAPGVHYSNANLNGLWKGQIKIAPVRTVECNPAPIFSDSWNRGV